MASEPVERIAAEAEDARARIASTIDEIQDRLDPRRLVSDAVGRVQDSGREFTDRATSAVRAHPLALGAAVAAVGLALVARNRLSKARVDLGDDLRDYTDYDDGFGFAEGHDIGEAPAPVGERAQALVGKAGDTVAANPVVSILLGVIAGAALGAILPSSEAERKALGETGGRIGAAARAAARRASEELEAAGLGLDSVRTRASDAARQAKAAAQSVVSAVRDELKG